MQFTTTLQYTTTPTAITIDAIHYNIAIMIMNSARHYNTAMMIDAIHYNTAAQYNTAIHYNTHSNHD